MRRDGTTLRVEFLGLPGVGKTLLSRRTAAHLLRSGRTVFEPVRAVSDRSSPGSSLRGYAGKAWWVVRELASHPRQSLRAARAIRATSQPSSFVMLKLVFNWLMQCSLLRASRHDSGVHLFDEGIFQALWSIGLEGREGAVHEVARACGAALTLPDVVAVIDSELAVVSERLRRRTERDSRADRWGPDDHAAIERAAALMREVIGALEERGAATHRMQVIRLHNGTHEDPDITARQLAAAIEHYAAARPSN